MGYPSSETELRRDQVIVAEVRLSPLTEIEGALEGASEVWKVLAALKALSARPVEVMKF